MKVLLINQNATIDRLVTLSTGKLLFDITKSTTISESHPDAYDFVIVDSDVYEQEAFISFKEGCGDATFLMIMSKGFEKPAGFDIFIEKPFLPTELVDILSTTRSAVPSFEPQKFEENALPSMDNMSEIPSLDDFGTDDELPSDSLDIGDMMTLDDSELSEPSFGTDDEIRLDGLDDSDSFGEDEIKLDGLEMDSDEAPQSLEPMGGGEDELSLDGLDFGDMDAKESTDDELDIGSSEEFSLDGLDDVKAELEDDGLSLPDVQEESTGEASLDTLDIGDFDSDSDEIKLDGLEDEAILPELGEELAGTDEDDLSLDGLEIETGEDSSVKEEIEVAQDEEPLSLDDLDIGSEEIELPAVGEDEITLDDVEELSLDMDDATESPVQEDALEIPELQEDEIGLEEGVVSEEDNLLGALDELNDDLQSAEADNDEDVSLSFEEHEKEHGADDEEEEEEVKVPSSIFGDDEVKKLKDLLDEADDKEESFDPAEVKVENDDLGSLTEESLAEALGVELDETSENSDLSEVGLDNLELPQAPIKQKETASAPSTEMTAADLLSMPLDRLRALLDEADISVNITLSKKR